MGTYPVVSMGSDPDIADRTIPLLLHGRVFVGEATRVGGEKDGIGNAVDESHHRVLPVPDVITVPHTEHA